MRLRLTYSHKVVKNPILSNVILKTGIQINILQARVDANNGELIISILSDNERLKEIINIFRSEGIKVQVLRKALKIDTEKCMDCGACISPCPTKAITFKPDWSIDLNEDKCIACGICVKACPTKALSLL